MAKGRNSRPLQWWAEPRAQEPRPGRELGSLSSTPQAASSSQLSSGGPRPAQALAKGRGPPTVDTLRKQRRPHQEPQHTQVQEKLHTFLV